MCATPPNPNYTSYRDRDRLISAAPSFTYQPPVPLPLVHHRPFYLVYKHLAHRFAFTLVLLHRIGNVVLSHLLLLSAHGLRLRLSLHARGPLFPTNLPLTLLLVAQAMDTVATEFFLDEFNVIYTTPGRRLSAFTSERTHSILIYRDLLRTCCEAFGLTHVLI